MELQDPLIPGGHTLHLQVRLVAHHMINEVQLGGWQALKQNIFGGSLESGQKVSGIAIALHKCVGGVTVLK